MDSGNAAPPVSRWLLYRIDDNGNEMAMRRFARREEAEAAMRDYQARGHKQTYLLREEKADGADQPVRP